MKQNPKRTIKAWAISRWYPWVYSIAHCIMAVAIIAQNPAKGTAASELIIYGGIQCIIMAGLAYRLTTAVTQTNREYLFVYCAPLMYFLCRAWSDISLHYANKNSMLQISLLKFLISLGKSYGGRSETLLQTVKNAIGYLLIRSAQSPQMLKLAVPQATPHVLLRAHHFVDIFAPIMFILDYVFAIRMRHRTRSAASAASMSRRA